MVVLTPVARDPGLLCMVVRINAWKNCASRHPLPERQSRWTLPAEPGFYAWPFVIHSRSIPKSHAHDCRKE
jgi:hypothetical protein